MRAGLHRPALLKSYPWLSFRLSPLTTSRSTLTPTGTTLPTALSTLPASLPSARILAASPLTAALAAFLPAALLPA